MMKPKRHVGKIASTDQRCVVAYMQIPSREDHALVIPTDSLPPRYEQAVMDIVESNEGQADETLANVLGRRIMENGKSVLQSLHELGKLQAVPVSNILMLPQPNMPFPLEHILNGLRRNIPQNTNPRYADVAMQKYNPHTTNQRADGVEEATGQARNLLIEAEMLQEEADRKRKQAYQIAPHLEPNATSPSYTDVVQARSENKAMEVEKKVRPSRRKAEKA
jgi:hypothetical protein